MGGSTIAVGNVVGSNLANIGLILGIAALLTPVFLRRGIIAFEIPVMVATGPIAYAIMYDGVITRLEGAGLVAGLVIFTLMTIRRGKLSAEDADLLAGQLEQHETARGGGVLWYLTLVVAGLVGLVAGAEALVRGARFLAEAAGVGERIIALTLVAVGTSLPELATTVVAAWKGEGDIALGNVLGSNIFNIFSVLGITALVGPVVVPEGTMGLDLPAMIGIQILVAPLMFIGRRLTRFDGLLLLAAYAGYIAVLFLQMP
jgi:cation:H+ antiporter